MEISLEHSIISCLALSPGFENDRLCFAGTDRSLFLSRDGGQTWQDALRDFAAGIGIDGPMPITAVLCAAQPGGPPLVIACLVGGYLRSEDGGISWQIISAGSPPPQFAALASGPEGGLYAATAEDGVFISQDSGRTWARWNFGLLDWHCFSLAVLPGSSSRTVLAGTETGVFISSNNGRAWRETSFPIDAGAVLALGASMGDNLLFAGTEKGTLFRSADLGGSWEQIAEGLFPAEISALVRVENGLLVASGSTLWISRDNGDHWKPWNSTMQIHGSVLCAAAPGRLTPGSTLMVGSDTGLFFLSED